MTGGHDPSNPHGGQGGWSAPPQHPPAQDHAPPVPGYGAPPPSQGWSAPPQSPPRPPAQQGWSPPPQPAQQGWTAPAANPNAKAQWAETSPQVRSPVDWFFKPPPELPESKQGIYKLLTLAAGPLLVFCFFAFYMFKARYRRYGVTGFFAVYSHFLGTAVFASIFFWIGGALGFDGWFLAAPMVVLAWIPLAARYALWKLV